MMSDFVDRVTVLRCIKESRENIDWGQSEDGDAFLHYSAALYRTIASPECLPSAQPEIVRCCECAFWDRDTLRHQFNDFRDWNEAECKVLAERDGYNEINHYVEADDYCSRGEKKDG